MTPPSNPDPGPLIANWPRPTIETSIELGGQFAASSYVTENVIVVLVSPEPGLAEPALSTGAACDLPLQLAATTGVVAGDAGDRRNANSKNTPAPIVPARARTRV